MGKEAKIGKQKDERSGAVCVARPNVLRSFGSILDRVQATRVQTTPFPEAYDQQPVGVRI